MAAAIHPTIRPASDFKRRFLLLLMLSGAAFTGIFEIGAMVGAIPLTRFHFAANLAHIAVALTLTGLLIRWPERLLAIAWAQAVNAFLIFLSALYAMPTDEMRFVWFFVQAAGTFLLIGTMAGWGTIALTIAIVIWSRAMGLIEVSANGIGTFSIGLACCGALLHAYNRQALRHITDLEAAYRTIDTAARHDALTGLLNLAAFRDLSAEIAELAERKGQPYSVLFTDVDHFKSVNDRLGHAGGDIVLVTVANTIRTAVRTSDVVARIGGEEILVLLPETDEFGAAHVAEKIRRAVEAARPMVEGVPLDVTLSIGWATARPPQGTLADIIRAADDAMYRAKHGGRNRVEPALNRTGT